MEKEKIQQIWEDIDLNISGRLFDHPFYTLTEIRHGIRSSFNEALGIDEELETAFQNGEESEPPIRIFESHPLMISRAEIKKMLQEIKEIRELLKTGIK